MDRENFSKFSWLRSQEKGQCKRVWRRLYFLTAKVRSSKFHWPALNLKWGDFLVNRTSIFLSLDLADLGINLASFQLSRWPSSYKWMKHHLILCLTSCLFSFITGFAYVKPIAVLTWNSANTWRRIENTVDALYFISEFHLL